MVVLGGIIGVILVRCIYHCSILVMWSANVRKFVRKPRLCFLAPLLGLLVGSFLNVVILSPYPVMLNNEWTQMAKEYWVLKQMKCLF